MDIQAYCTAMIVLHFNSMLNSTVQLWDLAIVIASPLVLAIQACGCALCARHRLDFVAFGSCCNLANLVVANWRFITFLICVAHNIS